MMFLFLLKRELLCTFRRKNELLQPILFLVILATLFPITIGPDHPALLTKIAPAIIWLGVILSLLLSSEKFYKNDFEDGSLEQLYLHGRHEWLAVISKFLVYWVLSLLPMIIAITIPVFWYQMQLPAVRMTIITLLLGTPTLLLFALLGSALTLSVQRGSLLLMLLILPLYIPVLIFSLAAVSYAIDGADATGQLAILLAFLVAGFTLLPLAIIAVIKAVLSES